jgi:hypothetical protein
MRKSAQYAILPVLDVLVVGYRSADRRLPLVCTVSGLHIILDPDQQEECNELEISRSA